MRRFAGQVRLSMPPWDAVEPTGRRVTNWAAGRRGLRPCAVAAVVAISAVALGACEPESVAGRTGPETEASDTVATPEVTRSGPPPQRSPTPSTTEILRTAQPRTALALLAALRVQGRAANTDYDRAQFGPWADTDRNGCDTRNDILARDLSGETYRAGTHGCVVTSGRMTDPYTATAITFTKANAQAVEIDHVVSLSNAWQTGAFAWSAGKRLAFANDPINLLAVSRAANQQKSDGDAATWLPPNKGYRCAIVARQTAVKSKYRLWVTPPERDAIVRVLSACPTMVPPGGGTSTTAPVTNGFVGGTTTQAPAPTRSAATSTASSARDYTNCDEMNIDFKGGVARPGAVDRRSNGGSATYTPHYDADLYEANIESDGDQDGIACEQ